MKQALRWGGMALLAVFGAGTVAVVTVYVLSTVRLQRVHSVRLVVPRTVPTDPAAIGRGKHIAAALASCTLCHGADLGGQLLGKEGPIGTLAAPISRPAVAAWARRSRTSTGCAASVTAFIATAQRCSSCPAKRSCT